MRILMVTQWFNPEPMLKGLMFLRRLKERGYEIQVLTGFPNYPEGTVYDGYRQRLFFREEVDGISILRVPLYPSHDANRIRRAANYLSFALSASVLGPWRIEKADVVYAYNPPATASLPALAVRSLRRIPMLLEVQDLWPDTLPATGMVSNRLVLRALGRWCGLAYRASDRIIVLSPGFKEALASRGVPADKIEVVYNWSDEEENIFRAARNDELSRELGFRERFTVLYSGTMGRAQALDAVLDAAGFLKERNPLIRFAFIGGGIERSRLERRARDERLHNVAFFPRVPVDRIGEVLQLADALLVHLKDDPLFRITIPSKIQAYLAAGKPILAAVTGNAAELVQRAGAGVVCVPGSAESIADAAERLFAMPEPLRKQLGESGRRYYTTELALEIGVRRYDAILKTMVG